MGWIARLPRKGKIRLALVCAGALAILAFLIYCLSTIGTSGAIGTFFSAFDKTQGAGSGIMEVSVTLTEETTGTAGHLIGQKELGYNPQAEAKAFKRLLSSTGMPAEYYGCDFFDGSRYCFTDGQGWYIYVSSFYREKFRQELNFSAGGEIEKSQIETATKTTVDGKTSVVFTMKEDTELLPVEIPGMGDGSCFLRESEISMLLSDQGYIDRLERKGTVIAVDDSGYQTTYAITSVYTFSELGQSIEVSSPEGL